MSAAALSDEDKELFGALVDTVVQLIQELACCLCGEVFTADAPEDVKDEKYDDAAIAIVTLLKYGSGMPFNRLARLQSSTGIPLAASTQWELCEKMGTRALPVFLELVRYAAQGGLIHTDDTTAKILGVVSHAISTRWIHDNS